MGSGSRRQEPPQAEEWVGGRFSVPVYVVEDGAPLRPDVVVWFEPASESVVGSQLIFPDDSDEVVVDGLRATMAKPSVGPPRTPRRIRVANARLAAWLRRQLDGRIEVSVGETPELDAVVENLAETLAGHKIPPTYLATPGLTPAMVASFFHAAALLQRTAPWSLPVDDAQLLAIDIPRLDIREAFLSVIGKLGPSRGYLFFESQEDFDAFTLLASGETIRRYRGELAHTRFMSQTFERGYEIAPSLRREIMAHGWEVGAADAYPYLVLVDMDAVVRPLAARDLVIASVCSLGIARFVREHRQLFHHPRPSPISATYRVPVGDERVQVRITGPHPRVGWHQAPVARSSGASAEYRALEDARAEAEEVSTRFLEDAEREGRSAAWVRTAAIICESLYDFKAYFADGDLRHWRAGDVESYLMSFLPRRVPASREEVERTPEVVTVFFDWLAAQELLSPRAAEAVKRRVARRQEAFFKRALAQGRRGRSVGPE